MIGRILLRPLRALGFFIGDTPSEGSEAGPDIGSIVSDYESNREGEGMARVSSVASLRQIVKSPELRAYLESTTADGAPVFRDGPLARLDGVQTLGPSYKGPIPADSVDGVINLYGKESFDILDAAVKSSRRSKDAIQWYTAHEALNGKPIDLYICDFISCMFDEGRTVSDIYAGFMFLADKINNKKDCWNVFNSHSKKLINMMATATEKIVMDAIDAEVAIPEGQDVPHNHWQGVFNTDEMNAYRVDKKTGYGLCGLKVYHGPADASGHNYIDRLVNRLGERLWALEQQIALDDKDGRALVNDQNKAIRQRQNHYQSNLLRMLGGGVFGKVNDYLRKQHQAHR